MARENFRNKQRYVTYLMQQNSLNPNITSAQADFLKNLATYRHLLHASPQQYFFNTKKTAEIDNFFAIAQSQLYFSSIGLPFPDKILDKMKDIQFIKNKQFVDIDAAIDEFAEEQESLNSLIEDYLEKIDKDKGTKYCPTGHLRNEEKVSKENTVNKLTTSFNSISYLQKQIQQKLDKQEKSLDKKYSIGLDEIIFDDF